MSSQPVRRSSSGSSQRPGPSQQHHADKGPDLLCRLRYSNTLPDVPFDGKFLPCPFVALDRFIDYKPSLLEKEHKFEVLCEADLGVEIDLIDPYTYRIDTENKKPLHPADLELLEDDSSRGFKKGVNLKRSQQHSKVVPWMRKTEYISSEFNRFGVSADRQETKVGYSIKKTEVDVYRDRASQIRAIEKTFEDAKKKVTKHYSKKDVHAVEEFPILPDFNWWRYSFAQVVFDADPAMLSAAEEYRHGLLEQGQIRGMQDDDGNQFVGYFTPTVETMLRRKKEKDEGVHDPEFTYEFTMNREYTWDVKNKASKGYEAENYFFTFREGCVFYNELDTRVKLTRRRQTTAKNSRLHLQFVELPANEIAQMDHREQLLLRPYDVKEDEEEEAAGEEEEDEAEGGAEEIDAQKVTSSGAAARSSDSDSDEDTQKKEAAKKTAAASDDSSLSSD